MKQMNSLQGMRFVAFAAIFLLHCFSGKFSYAAAWAVSFFFMLSGYLYGMKYNENSMDDSGKGILNFTKNRIKKFYSLHALTTVAVLPLCGISVIIATQNWTELWNLMKNTFFSLTLLQSWIPSYYHGLNGVSWFLSTIMFLYFVTPWFVKAGQAVWKKGKMLGIAISILLLITVQYTYSTIAGSLSAEYEFWLYTFPIARMAEYCVGIFLGIWNGHVEEEARNIPWSDLWMTLVCFVVAGFCFFVPNWSVILWRSVIWMAPNVFILILMTGEGSIWQRILGSKIMVWLGNHSFALFLIHQVFARYVSNWTDIWDSSRMWKLIYCVFVFVVSLLLSVVWEFFSKKSK